MFGYVRPLKGELKVREYELYQAAYCGLCEQLKRRLGRLSTLMLNYDLTFLSVLLMALDEDKGFMQRRCAASPFKKKNMCVSCSGLEAAADITVILGYEKLRDDKSDSGFAKRLVSAGGLLLFKGAYKKASAARPDFATRTRQLLSELSLLEKEKCSSMDAAAHTFASILAAAGRCTGSEHASELEELLYQVGRWVYIVDAADDLEEDAKSGGYNPVALRFDSSDGTLKSEDKVRLKDTLDLSASLAGDVAENLPLGKYSALIMNILDLGLPFVAARVLNGQWRSKARKI